MSTTLKKDPEDLNQDSHHDDTGIMDKKPLKKDPSEESETSDYDTGPSAESSPEKPEGEGFPDDSILPEVPVSDLVEGILSVNFPSLENTYNSEEDELLYKMSFHGIWTEGKHLKPNAEPGCADAHLLFDTDPDTEVQIFFKKSGLYRRKTGDKPLESHERLPRSHVKFDGNSEAVQKLDDLLQKMARDMDRELWKDRHQKAIFEAFQQAIGLGVATSQKPSCKYSITEAHKVLPPKTPVRITTELFQEAHERLKKKEEIVVRTSRPDSIISNERRQLLCELKSTKSATSDQLLVQSLHQLDTKGVAYVLLLVKGNINVFRFSFEKQRKKILSRFEMFDYFDQDEEAERLDVLVDLLSVLRVVLEM